MEMDGDAIDRIIALNKSASAALDIDSGLVLVMLDALCSPLFA